MSGIKPFVFGAMAGSFLIYGALQYHIVRSDEGMYLVPRSPKNSLAMTYADTRNWTADNWNRYPQLTQALRENGAADLIGDAEIAVADLQDAEKSPDEMFEAGNLSDHPDRSPNERGYVRNRHSPEYTRTVLVLTILMRHVIPRQAMATETLILGRLVT